jgi:hypothetical protein
MLPRLSLLLTVAALAAFPAAAHALPAGRTLIASGAETMDTALPAPVGSWTSIDYRGAVSDTGQYVAFSAHSDGLSTEDDDRYENVYVKNRVTGSVTLVSRQTGAAGEPSHGDCDTATISDDGTRVAFACMKSLDPAADTNAHRDVYVRDLVARTTTLVSRATNGAVANGEADQPMIAGGGDEVVFRSAATNLDGSDSNPQADVYWRSLGGAPATKLVSRATGVNGTVGDQASFAPSVTDDGEYVSFGSQATNLGAFPDTNDLSDIYVRGVAAATTQLVSAPDFGGTAIANGNSEWSAISGELNNGQYYVAFNTWASNLGAVDTNQDPDVYRRALNFPSTVLITRTAGPSPQAIPGGGWLGGISDSGTDVAFGTNASLDPADTIGSSAAYVRHTAAGTTELLTRHGDAGPVLNIDAGAPAVSGDGDTYALSAEGGGGLPGADPIAGSVVARDIHSSPHTTASIARPPGTAPFVNQGADAQLAEGGRSISADGSRVAFVAVRGGMARPAAWVRDLRTGAVTLASRADGADGKPTTDWIQGVKLSANGNRVAFVTADALDPADKDDVQSLYVRDVAANRTMLASRADGPAGASANDWAGNAALDADGSRVAFDTSATNLGDGDTDPQTDVHVRDLETGRTLLAGGGNGGSYSPAIDASGTHVAFASEASDLGDGDKDGTRDIHVRDLGTRALRLVSTTPKGVKGDAGSHAPQISEDGTVVAFYTNAPALLPAGAATHQHVVVRDLARNTLVAADREDGANGALPDENIFDFALSGDGSKVAWVPNIGYLPDPAAVPAKQVRVRDLAAATTVIGTRMDGIDGAPISRGGENPSLNRDGSCLAFATRAPIARGAGTDYRQVYVRTLGATCAPTPTPTPMPTPGGDPAPDTKAPVLSGVRLSRKRVGRRGTVLRFTTSEAGTLRVKVQRRRKGAFRPKAKLKRTVTAGKGKLRFSRRVGGHALRRGRYRLVVTVTDAAGNRSQAAKVRFRIVR